MLHPGSCARFMRRTAELLLESSERWAQIERDTQECKQYYKELLASSHVNETAFRTAANVLSKIVERPSLLEVWSRSCPALLRGKQRELELQSEGAATYNEVLQEKMRIGLIQRAVLELKLIGQDRPVTVDDIVSRQEEVGDRAKAEMHQILEQERILNLELKRLGDGTEKVLVLERLCHASLSSNLLDLKEQELLRLPACIFCFTHVEVLDLSYNNLTELPAAISELKVLKKLFLNHNRLTTLPRELSKLSHHLVLLALSENPLDSKIKQLWLTGLPTLLKFLKTHARTQLLNKAAFGGGSGWTGHVRLLKNRMNECALSSQRFDLFDAALPRYVATAPALTYQISARSTHGHAFEVDLAATRPAASLLTQRLSGFARIAENRK
uniref:Uncharacterized protein n=1 Tax=Coccolithus braarudii TaxID=221442 RepID=A0A7S0Q436_9EUKA